MFQTRSSRHLRNQRFQLRTVRLELNVSKKFCALFYQNMKAKRDTPSRLRFITSLASFTVVGAADVTLIC